VTLVTLPSSEKIVNSLAGMLQITRDTQSSVSMTTIIL